MRRELFETREPTFDPILSHVLLVGEVGLSEPTIVRNILSKGEDAVNVEFDLWRLVGAVLISDAVRLLRVLLQRLIGPPRLRVTVLIELTT
jgi:hypothetical protein